MGHNFLYRKLADKANIGRYVLLKAKIEPYRPKNATLLLTNIHLFWLKESHFQAKDFSVRQQTFFSVYLNIYT